MLSSKTKEGYAKIWLSEIDSPAAKVASRYIQNLEGLQVAVENYMLDHNFTDAEKVEWLGIVDALINIEEETYE